MPSFTENFDTAGDYTLTRAQISGGLLSLDATGESTGDGNALKVANINSGGRVGSATLTKTDTVFDVNVYAETFASDVYTESGMEILSGRLLFTGTTSNGTAIKTAAVTTKSPIHEAKLDVTGTSGFPGMTFQLSRDNRNFYNVTENTDFDFEAAGAADFEDTGRSQDTTFKSLVTRFVSRAWDLNNDIETVNRTGTNGTVGIHSIDEDTAICIFTRGGASTTYRVGKTTDGGATWSTLTDVASVTTQTNPACDILALSSTKYVAFYKSAATTLSCKTSTDSGTTWGSAVQIATGIRDASASGTICARHLSGDTIFVAVVIGAAGNPDVYKSTDAGATWNNLDNPVLTAGATSCGLIVYDSNNLVLFETFTGTSGGVDVAYSTDGGANWTDGPTGNSVVAASAAALDCTQISSDEILVVYLNNNSYRGIVWNNTSHTFGTSFTISTSVPTAAADARAAVSRNSSTNTIAFVFANANEDTQIIVSYDNGTTWVHERAILNAAATTNLFADITNFSSNRFIVLAGYSTATSGIIAGSRVELPVVDSFDVYCKQYIDYYITRNNRHYFRVTPSVQHIFNPDNETDANDDFTDTAQTADPNKNVLKTRIELFTF